jgi:hypothetical protein
VRTALQICSALLLVLALGVSRLKTRARQHSA